MKLPKREKVVLRYMLQAYRARHGTRLQHLEEFTIFIMDDGLRVTVPDLFENDSSLSELKSVFCELANRGLVRVHGSDRNYSLTEKGAVHASEGIFRKAVNYFNANPGWAIVI
jgi:hypothetical protein